MLEKFSSRIVGSFRGHAGSRYCVVEIGIKDSSVNFVRFKIIEIASGRSSKKIISPVGLILMSCPPGVARMAWLREDLPRICRSSNPSARSNKMRTRNALWSLPRQLILCSKGALRVPGKGISIGKGSHGRPLSSRHFIWVSLEVRRGFLFELNSNKRKVFSLSFVINWALTWEMETVSLLFALLEARPPSKECPQWDKSCSMRE